MLQRTLTVWAKELLDTLRDRRTLAVMILAPVLLMPVFTLLPQVLMGGQIKEGQAGSLVVDVHGVENGPQLVAFLRRSGAEIRVVTADPMALVREDGSRVIVAIPPDFSTQMAAEKPARVTIVLDDSQIKSSVVAGRLSELVAAFGREVAARRLTNRGMDPAILSPVEIERQNVATEQQMGGAFLGMFLPMFLVLFAFLGGMYTAIDVTAGEKERGTLEPLLAAPVGRGELVIGKLLTVFVTSYGAVILSLLSTYLTFQFAPGDLLGSRMSFALPLGKLLWLTVAALPLTLLLNGVEMIICIFARSFKEAQNYVTPVQLLLMIPALAVGFVPGLKAPRWAYAVPALGQLALFRDLLAGGPVDRARLALGLVSASLYAAVAIAIAVHTFRREDVLFRT